MTFNTLTFLLFLTIVFVLYWSIRFRQAQNWFLVIASYTFYGWWDYRFCVLMLGSSLIDYVSGLALSRVSSSKMRKLILCFSITASLGTLGLFKYFNFFAENFRAAASSIGWQVDEVTLRIVLPVGISFYTFQTMSYALDVYRQQIRATSNLGDYLAYVSFFPQLVAGPIERATHFLPQFTRPRVFDAANAADGCRQCLWGFFKKMVIADNLGPLVDPLFLSPRSYTGPELAMATVLFAVQIYCDFSAYSDIASGTARLFGFELMRNFAYPYFSQSAGEFWRRWHISLTSWFKDYVFIPLGGSRVSPVRRSFNIMIIFTLSGLWHGASWNFIVWGALNGILVLPSALFPGHKKRITSDQPPAAHKPVMALPRIFGTFILVCLGWIFFRSASLGDSFYILGKIISGFGSQDSVALALSVAVGGNLGVWLLLAIVFFISMEWVYRCEPHPLVLRRIGLPGRWLVYTGLSWATLLWGTFGGSQFIYFQF